MFVMVTWKKTGFNSDNDPKIGKRLTDLNQMKIKREDEVMNTKT